MPQHLHKRCEVRFEVLYVHLLVNGTYLKLVDGKRHQSIFDKPLDKVGA